MKSYGSYRCIPHNSMMSFSPQVPRLTVSVFATGETVFPSLSLKDMVGALLVPSTTQFIVPVWSLATFSAVTPTPMIND